MPLNKEQLNSLREEWKIYTSYSECDEDIQGLIEMSADFFINRINYFLKERDEELVEKMKPLLEEYVGDNVGQNCLCENCQENRQKFINLIKEDK